LLTGQGVPLIRRLTSSRSKRSRARGPPPRRNAPSSSACS